MNSAATAPRRRRRRRRHVPTGPEPTPLGKDCALQVCGEETLLRLPWAGLGEPDDAGAPGAFDREVFRACEWAALEEARRHGGTVPDPFVFTGRTICERLCLRESPALADRLQRSFKRLAELRLKGAGIGFLLSLADGFNGSWSRTRGLEAPRAVRFDPAYRASVRARRLVPLCWDAWIALSTPGRRLLEILAPALARRGAADGVSFHVAELAEWMPLPRGARAEVFDVLHRELAAAGVLREVSRAGAGAFERFVYLPGRTDDALQERVRASGGATISVLARELAAEFGDADGLLAFQSLVERHEPDAIEVARKELRQLMRWGGLQGPPRERFERLLAQGGREARRA